MTKTEEIMELANDHALAYSLDGDWRQTHDALKSAIKELVAEVETAKSFERERCAKVIEEGLYPLPRTDYQIQYNAGVKDLANKIRSLE